LLASISSNQTALDHISIVWQDISNAGEPITKHALDVLMEAAESGLIDEVIQYHPDLSNQRVKNETQKRQIGLDAARAAGATHFLSLDADEFYRPKEILKARDEIDKNGWKSTSVSSFLHVKRPIYRALDKTCCCFITEISSDTQMGATSFPCPHIDPSRKMTASLEHHHHFSVELVAMYHMNLVRRDLDQKLRNSSTVNTVFLKKVADAVSGWEPGYPLKFPNKGDIHFEQVGNEFETFDPGNVSKLVPHNQS